MRQRPTFFRVMAALLTSPLAAAAPPERLSVESASRCPSSADVARELGPILASTTIMVAGAAREYDSRAGNARATIEELDGALRIRVAAAEKILRVSNRACAERARAAAVVIALIVDPPLLPDATEPVPAQDPEPDRRAKAPRAPAIHELSVELGPTLRAAPASDSSALPVTGGFAARLAWPRTFGASLGAGIQLPATLHLGAADARLTLIPFDLSVRATARLAPLRFSADLGPEMDVVFARGARVENPRTSVRADLGVRGAVTAAWELRRDLGAFAAVHSVLFPRPYDLELRPGVRTGTTPAWWIGAFIGLFVDVL
jgi:hypothetical protein